VKDVKLVKEKGRSEKTLPVFKPFTSFTVKRL
jgi:hypothetical protein